ncbi:uncharacterized mitochondrial protein-like protein [Tanacetum coccineum]
MYAQKFQMSSMGELTFFLGLQVKEQSDGIFISQDKYVADILKKFDFLSIRTATTPTESNKPLVKDEDGVDEMYILQYFNPSTSSTHQFIKRFLGTSTSTQISFMVSLRDSSIELEALFKIGIKEEPSLDRKSDKPVDVNFLEEDLYLGNTRRRLFGANLLTKAEYVAAANYSGGKISMDWRMDRSCAANSTHIWSKPNESVGFTEVVDFLKGTSLRYALTHNPTIYDSLVKQFWQTITVGTLANGTQQLVASIASKEYTITEASVRSKLQLEDATGIHNLSDAEIYAGLATLRGYAGDIVPLLFLCLRILAVHAIDQVSLVRESMKEKSTDFVTPTKASGEAQEEEEISPTILEAAKTLSKVASQSVSKAKSTDKGKKYKRRARSMAKKINTELDAEDEINTGRVKINSGIEDVNTGSFKVDTSRTSISTYSIIHSPKKGQRERKAQMVEEDIQATHKTKEQIRQEEVGLEEAIRFQAQMDEEVAKHIHIDKMLAKRVQEEQELSEQQLKRKAKVQKAAQFYTEEDWDTIREKLEANTEVVKSLQGESISNDDFAKRMVEMINEKKKFYAKQKAKAKRILQSFVPSETEESEKTWNYIYNQETSKKTERLTLKDASIIREKDEVVKEEEA